MPINFLHFLLLASSSLYVKLTGSRGYVFPWLRGAPCPRPVPAGPSAATCLPAAPYLGDQECSL